MKGAGILLLTLVFCIAGSASAVVTIYSNDYNSEPLGGGFPAWNWIDGDTANGFVKSHTAVYADWGNMVVEHTGHIDNSAGTTDVNTRFGSKWTITVSGNTSTNPEDYTISFDVCSVFGNWDPIALEFFVLTGTGNGVGKGSGIMNFSQADGWVHVEKKLSELTVGWWNGSAWVLTDSTWQIELGGPGWPGWSVPAGTPAWDQIWLFDNLKITMIPEPTTMALMGLGMLTALRKRK
jgi:hypothetical protein